MKSYDSIFTKHFFDETDKNNYAVCKLTGIIPTKENKGALYIFNNEEHVQLVTRDNKVNFFLNILRNGSCNGIPQEIGELEDRTITSFVLNEEELNSLDRLISDLTIALNDVINLEEATIDKNFIPYAKNIITIIKNFKNEYYETIFKDFKVVYFDVYFKSHCNGYMYLDKGKTNTIIDFVKMNGYNTAENLKVGGSTINGVNVGHIKPAPFTLGPIVFNPIGNESFELDSNGLTINYIGLLRTDPKNFKEFRIYLTLKLNPLSHDGKFVGKSEELYKEFTNFITKSYDMIKNNEEVDFDTALNFILDSIKIEIQGENPDKIKAIDIATIFYKAFINLTINDLDGICGDNEGFINPNAFENESDNVCVVTFKEDHVVTLKHIFIK